MKSLSKISLYVFAALAVISGLYVILSPGSMSADDAWSPDKGPVTFIIMVTLVALVVAVVLFLIYKVVDIFKHPSHTKEAMYVFGAIIIAFIIGLVFSSGDQIIYGNGEVYEAGTSSKLIGTGLLTTGVLFFAAVIYMIVDTVKGIIKS